MSAFKKSPSSSLTPGLGAGCFALDTVRVLDLSHPLNDQTIFWPGGEKFSLCMSTFGGEDDFFSIGHISCAEHGGTHIDAPYHFSRSGQTVDQLPLTTLMGHCRVIDVESKVWVHQLCATESGWSDKVASNDKGDYYITREDIESYEECYGPLLEGEIVLFRTGWAERCYSLGSKIYLGFDERVDGEYDPATSKLCFPGIGVEAAHYLVSKKVAGVGLDTASLDPGSCGGFLSHRIILSAGIYGIENINGEIGHLPPCGATIMTMPLKLTGGSGSPSRVVAFVPK